MMGVGCDLSELEERLSHPTDADAAAMRRLEGDILILGVAGKMGPTLARLARRATDMTGKRRRVIGVSRFSDPSVRDKLDEWEVETIAADLLRRREVDALPDAANVVFMAGQKFGTDANPSHTWATNAYIPMVVGARYRGSRIVVFSSGNVYPLSDVEALGPTEAGPVGPVGEYAQSVLARERLFEYFSERHGTPMAIMRLNYAVEPRYGVFRDIADTVRARHAVDLSMGWVNVIWQRDANSIALRLLEHCDAPPFVLNVTGARRLRVQWVAERFAEAFGVGPVFRGEAQPTALLSDATLCRSLFGPPTIDVEEMIGRVARWVEAGGAGLGKPTKFTVRDGSF